MKSKPTKQHTLWSRLLDLLLVVLATVLIVQWWQSPQQQSFIDEQYVDEQLAAWEQEWEEQSFSIEEYSRLSRLQAIANDQTTRLEFAQAEQWTPEETALLQQAISKVRVMHVYDSSHQWLEQLQHIEALPGLEQIHLHVPAGAEFFALLNRMPGLKVLNVPQLTTEVNADALAEIPRHNTLQLLRLGGRNCDLSFLKVLSQSASIEYLHFLNSSLTDADLLVLDQQSQLQSLYIDDSPVTEEGLWQLCEKLPQLHVHWNDLHLTNATE